MENPTPTRPTVTIHSATTGLATSSSPLPAIFLAPLRGDLIQSCHTGISRNHRQPYGVMAQHGPSGKVAGHGTSAHSWGTGRAVSRIPRVGGSGTHRSGQGAIGNMCRGGHMFAPTKVWRRWHCAVNKRERRLAVAAAVAASGVASVVMARGHLVEGVQELPLVVSDEVESLRKTADAVECLKKVGAYGDVERVLAAKGLRAGRGKMRGRRKVMRKGPLVVYKNDGGLVKAFRNVPGVDLCCVDRLNLLQLAPGAHPGRFVVWTESAFKALDKIFGTDTTRSEVKKGFVIPRHNILTNTDLARIINSDEIQRVLRPKQTTNGLKKRPKLDALLPQNASHLLALNPHAHTAPSAATSA